MPRQQAGHRGQSQIPKEKSQKILGEQGHLAQLPLDY
jgi:hypothetical protein